MKGFPWVGALKLISSKTFNYSKLDLLDFGTILCNNIKICCDIHRIIGGEIFTIILPKQPTIVLILEVEN